MAGTRARNLLCVRLDSLGDVLMATPAIRALKESGEERHITLLTSPAGAAVARLVPEMDDVIVYDAPWLKATAPRTSSQPERDMVERLRQRRFDAAIIFTVYSQNPLPSALLCYLADIPLRLAHCRENPYQLLTHWIPDPEPDRLLRHEVRRQLDLVATIGCRTSDERMSLRVPIEAHHHILRVLHELDICQSDGPLASLHPWIVIHPGASAPSRRYPPEGFAQAARQLVEKTGCQVIWTGTGSERELIAHIQQAMGIPSHSLVDRLDLAQMAALLALSPLLISNNTGPVHMAAAVGTPVVDLYALTNPQHTPWGVPNRVLFHDVPCKYCYKSVCPLGHQDCLRLVPAEAIVEAACDVLGEFNRDWRVLIVQGGLSTPPMPVCPVPLANPVPGAVL